MENTNETHKWYYRGIGILLIISILGCGPSKEEKEKMFLDSGFIIGNVITNDISNRIISSLIELDSKLTYEVLDSNITMILKKNNEKFPLIETVITTKSRVLKDPKIKYQLKMSLDENSEVIVGLLRNISVDNKVDKVLTSITKNSYIIMVDDSTVQQVEFRDGGYYYSDNEIEIEEVVKERFKGRVEEYQKEIQRRKQKQVQYVRMCGNLYPKGTDFLDFLPSGWEERIGYYSIRKYSQGCDNFRVVWTDDRGILISFRLEYSGERVEVLYTCDGELW